MTDYRRYRVKGGTYFFTVNLAAERERKLLTERIDALRETFRDVKRVARMKRSGIRDYRNPCFPGFCDAPSGLLAAHFMIRRIVPPELPEKSRELAFGLERYAFGL